MTRLAVGAGVAILLSATTGSAVAVTRGTAPRFEVVATHLNNPRKLFVGAGGAVYVAEAGRGGRQRCLRFGTEVFCVGLSGSITRVALGTSVRVVTGLWSGAARDGSQAEGPAAVYVHGRLYYVLLQDTAVTSNGTNELGPDGSTAGSLITTGAGRARPAVVVNLAAFEAAHNPDHGAGPGDGSGT